MARRQLLPSKVKAEVGLRRSRHTCAVSCSFQRRTGSCWLSYVIRLFASILENPWMINQHNPHTHGDYVWLRENHGIWWYLIPIDHSFRLIMWSSGGDEQVSWSILCGGMHVNSPNHSTHTEISSVVSCWFLKTVEISSKHGSCVSLLGRLGQLLDI